MKNIIIVTVLLTVGILTGHSQSKKNDLKLTVSALPLYGNSGGFYSGLNGFVIKPGVGYFISEKTSIDLNFTYAIFNHLKIDNINSFYNSYAFVPTLRNNFVNTKQLRVFGEFGFGLGSIKYNSDNTAFRTDEHRNLSGGISILNVGVGANYFFNDTFGVELILPYINTQNITSDSSSNIYSGIGPTLGLTFKLN